GLMVTRLGLPSLAVTIGTLALFRGLAYVVIGDESVTDFPGVWTDRAFGNFAGTFVPNTIVLFAVLAIVISLRNSTAAANVGQGFELTAITAVLLGGVSIFGGRGTIAGVILALFLLGGMQKAILLSDSISSYWIQIVTGILLVGSVLGPNVARRVREARRRRASHTKEEGS